MNLTAYGLDRTKRYFWMIRKKKGEREMNTAIVSGHIYYDGNHKDIEILTKIDDEEVYTGIFDDIDHALIDDIDIGESEDYYFIAIVKSKWVSYYTCDGEEWEVEHEVTEVKSIDDLKTLEGILP